MNALERNRLVVARDVYGKHWCLLSDEELATLPDLVALAMLEAEEAER